ncbi:hypothetical protein ACVBEQ_24665 [Nakamurella sp. GG22]
MTARRAVRVLLVVLAVVQGTVGGWALFAPESFYRDFPGGGRGWVALLPEYNEHLTRDVGALSLSLTLVLVAAAVTMERTLVQVALAATAVYAVPHTLFHALHLEGFPGPDAVAQTAVTIAQVVLVVVALLLSTWLPRRTVMEQGHREERVAQTIRRT